jgi:hypothetical protein
MIRESALLRHFLFLYFKKHVFFLITKSLILIFVITKKTIERFIQIITTTEKH